MFRSTSRLAKSAVAGGRSIFSHAPFAVRFAAVASGVAAGVVLSQTHQTRPHVAFAAEAAPSSSVESKTAAATVAGWATKQEVLARLDRLQTGLASTAAADAVKQLIQEWTQNDSAPVEYKTKGSIGSYVDHTLLKPVASKADIEAVVKEAVVNDFAGICVNSCNTAVAQAAIKKEMAAAGKTKSPLLVVVAGFPLGAAAHSVKKDELKFAIQHGANEVDVVINVGRLKEGAYSEVFEELSDLAQQAKSMNGKLKVIFETSMLSREEIIDACLICRLAKVDFVKTSTGFGGGGATVELIQLMSSIVKPNGRDLGVQVKASGGVRTYPDAIAVVKAGADRIGTSNGVAIAQGEKTGEAAPAGKGGY